MPPERPHRSSSPGDLEVELLHAAVPGRLRVRVRCLRGNGALAGAAEQRFRLIPGVRAAFGSARTASVLLSFEPTLNTDALLHEIHLALSELLGSWRPPDVLPTIVSTLPLSDASLSEVLGAFGRLVAKLVPSSPEGRGGSPAATPDRTEGVVAVRPADEAHAPRWHGLSALDALLELRSERAGLNEAEALRRRAEYGPNALPEPPRRSKIEIFSAQFRSVPVAMLGASAVLSVATGGLSDAAAILAVVLVNASIGYDPESPFLLQFLVCEGGRGSPHSSRSVTPGACRTFVAAKETG